MTANNKLHYFIVHPAAREAINNIIIRKGVAVLLILPFFTQAQNQDSLAQKASQFAANKFAERRPFSIDFKQFGNYNFSPGIRNQQYLQGGEITNWSILTVSANINLLQRSHWLLQANGFYRFVSANDRSSKQPANRQGYIRGDYYYHTDGLTISYFSKLFGKNAVYTAGIFVDGSDRSFERVRGQATGSIVLKANDKTKMSIGLMANADPGSMIPLLPIFVYEHKFNDKLMTDMMFPRYSFLRRRLFNYGRLSAGWELDQQTTFFLYNPDGTSRTYQFRQIDANIGLLYEHLLPGSFIFAVRAGYRVNPFVRVFEKNRSFNDYTWDASTDPAPYFNVGLSFNPFVKRKSK